MSSWRKPIPKRSVSLHDSLDSHVVTVQPDQTSKPVLFLDDLVLPYADESPTTTPVDLPPSTSGRHVSISGHSVRSANEVTSCDVWSRSATTPISDVAPMLSTSGRRISISGHSTTWSAGDATSTGTGSGGTATPASDVIPSRISPVDDESRDRCESMVSIPRRQSCLPADAVAGGSLDTASATGVVPIYRPSVAAETLRRCEPTHFHWTSTASSASGRPRPSLRPAIVDSIIVSSLVSSLLHMELYYHQPRSDSVLRMWYCFQ